MNYIKENDIFNIGVDISGRWETFKPNTSYAINDIFKTSTTPSWGYWQVTVSGTSGSEEPYGNSRNDTFISGSMECKLMSISRDDIAGLEEWQEGKHYDRGDAVIYNDTIYKSNTNNPTTASFVNSEWDEIGAGNATSASASEWETNVVYNIGNIVHNNNKLYLCLANHTSNIFSEDIISEYWRLISHKQSIVNYNNNFSQIVKDDAEAGDSLNVAISPNDDFCHPPIEFLKLTAGEELNITLNNFSSGEKSQFEFNDAYVEFDGEMKAREKIEIEKSESQLFHTSYYSPPAIPRMEKIVLDDNTLLLQTFKSNALIDDTGNTYTPVDANNVPTISSDVDPTIIEDSFTGVFTGGGISTTTNFSFAANEKWTIEFFCYIDNSVGNCYLLAAGAYGSGTDWMIYYENGNIILAPTSPSLSYKLSKDQWHHIAYVSDGEHVVLYIDGILKSSIPAQSIIGNSHAYPISIGSAHNRTDVYNLTGYITNIRISDIDRYSERFNPFYSPDILVNANYFNFTTEEINKNDFKKIKRIEIPGIEKIKLDKNTLLLHTFQNNVLLDDTGNEYIPVDNNNVPVISSDKNPPCLSGDNSCIFNGGGIYTNTNFNFAIDQEWTLELYYYSNTSQYHVILGATAYGYGTDWQLGYDGNNLIWSLWTNAVILSTPLPKDNNWHHIAYVSNGTGITLYIDGIAKNYYSASAILTNSRGCSFSIGSPYNSNVTSFTGYLSHIRLSNIARYSENFNPFCYPKTLLIADNNAYGYNNSHIFGLLASGWNSKGEQEKFNIAVSTVEHKYSETDIFGIGNPFNVAVYSENSQEANCYLYAIPKTQLVLPKTLISIDNYSQIKSIKASGTEKYNNNTIVLGIFDEMPVAEMPTYELECNMGSLKMQQDSILTGKKSLFLDGNSCAYFEDINTNAIKGDFSIDMWVKPLASFTGPIIWIGSDKGTRGHVAEGITLHTYNGHICFYASATQGSWNVASQTPAIPFVVGQWSHVAVIRKGAKYSSYYNGSLYASYNMSETPIYYPDNSLAIAGHPYASGIGTFLINGLRIIGNGDLYTEPFNPPTTYAKDGTGSIKMAIATDDEKYYTFNFTSSAWQEIQPTTEALLLSGIPIQDIENITSSDWDNILSITGKIGFAYVIDISETSGTIAINNLALDVELTGSWHKAIHNTDYTYGYPSSDILRINFMTDGTYKINYLA